MAYTNTTYTVTSTGAVRIINGSSRATDDFNWIIRVSSNSTGTVYVGGSSVTSTGGTIGPYLTAGDSFTGSARPGKDLYAIASGGTQYVMVSREVA